jgi:TP901-1 family phage major tail protein
MPAQKGRDLLLKLGSGGGAVTVAAMRATRFALNGDIVDATNKDSAGWRELVAGGGKATMSITAAGILSGSTQATDFVNRTAARSLDQYTLVFDNGDTIAGSFQCSNFEASGEHDGEQTYALTLQSSGALSVTAV